MSSTTTQTLKFYLALRKLVPELFKKIMDKIVYFLCVIILLSCQSPIEYKNNDFQQLKNNFKLSGTKITIEEFGRIHDLTISPNENLIFISFIGRQKMVSVYDLDFNFLGEFIERGDGPMQQLFNSHLQINEVDRVIYSVDVEKNSLFYYSLDSIKNGAFDDAFLKSEKFGDRRLIRPVVVSNDLIVDFSFEGDMSTFVSVDLNNGKSFFGEVPLLVKDMDPVLQPFAFTGKINYFPSLERLVVNYFLTDIIEIYDLNGKLLKSLHGPDRFSPQVLKQELGSAVRPVFDFDKAKFGYLSTISLFDNKYYVAYHGKSIKEDELTNTIFVFDDDLTLVKNFTLDTKISNFVVDPIKMRLLAFSMYEDSGLFSFSIGD
jgi:hypothetical protein